MKDTLLVILSTLLMSFGITLPVGVPLFVYVLFKKILTKNLLMDNLYYSKKFTTKFVN